MTRYIAHTQEELSILRQPAKAHLVLLYEGRPYHSFPLHNTLYIGRAANNNLVVRDKKVSRQHCALIPTNNTFLISDRESTNGTYVNGVAIGQPTRLHENDIIRIGDITLRFTLTSIV